MNQFTKKPPKPVLRQWQPQPAPVLPLTPDPAQPAVTWYQNYAGQIYPGYGTPYDIVAANIENINLVADNMNAINEIVSGEYLPIDGSIPMTGLLTLSGDPVLPLNAVPLEYLQLNYLNLAGGALTGSLTLAGPPQTVNGAATKGYVDQYAGIGYYGTWQVAANNPNISSGGTTNGQYFVAVTVNPNVPETAPAGIPGIAGASINNGDRIVWNAGNSMWEQIVESVNFPVYDARYLQLSGASPMQGPLVLSGNATANLQAVPLQQLQSTTAGLLPLSGGTMTGALTLAADPVSALQPVTLEYFQHNMPSASISVGDTPPASPSPGAMWWDSVGTQLYVFYNDGNSSQWVNTTNAGSGAVVALSDTPPSSPGIGTLWWDSADGQMYVYTFDGTSSQWVPVVNQSGQLSAAVAANTGRSLVHNGTFVVAQRGAGPWTANGNYTLDRWQLGLTSDTVSISQQPISDASRAQIGDESARWMLQNVFTGNAAAGAYNILIHKMEGAARLSNKTITVSFFAAASTAGLKLGINLAQAFGSGGSPSGAVYALATGAAVTLSGTWARYSATIAMPSTAGKTFGTNGDDTTQLFFYFSSGATANAQAGNIGVQSGTIYLWGVQLEVGSVATPLARRDPADELALCQRFYQTGVIRFVGYMAASAGAGYQMPLLVAMRATPTFTPTYSAQTNCTGASSNWDAQSVYISATVTALGTFVLTGTFTASADL